MHPVLDARGTVLIVTLWVIVALTGLTLTLAFSMRTEAMASANRVAQAQAEAAARGMEQWLLSAVDQEVATPGTLDDLAMNGRQIGDCYAWVVRPDYNTDETLAYGLADEAGKLDLNTATRDMLVKLPGMAEDVADAIVDWRDADTTVSAQGAEEDYYMSLPEPYHCKNAPLETVDELMLVKGITKDLLYGYDANRNGLVDGREAQSANAGSMLIAMQDTGVGIARYVTIYGIQATAGSSSSSSQQTADVNSTNTGRLQSVLGAALSSSRADQIVQRTRDERRTRPFANVFDFYFRANLSIDEFTRVYPRLTCSAVTPGTTQPSTTPRIGKINVNTAPREVLACLPQFDANDAAAIVSHRQNTANSDPSNIAWLASVLDRTKAVAAGNYVTGKSVCFSGDVVAINPNGRAFRRYRVVISDQETPARIIYRKDLTSSGWPLPAEIREAIRSGVGYEAPLTGGAQQ